MITCWLFKEEGGFMWAGRGVLQRNTGLWFVHVAPCAFEILNDILGISIAPCVFEIKRDLETSISCFLLSLIPCALPSLFFFFFFLTFSAAPAVAAYKTSYLSAREVGCQCFSSFLPFPLLRFLALAFS